MLFFPVLDHWEKNCLFSPGTSSLLIYFIFTNSDSALDIKIDLAEISPLIGPLFYRNHPASICGKICSGKSNDQVELDCSLCLLTMLWLCIILTDYQKGKSYNSGTDELYWRWALLGKKIYIFFIYIYAEAFASALYVERLKFQTVCKLSLLKSVTLKNENASLYLVS